MGREEIVERGMNAPLYAGVLTDATHRGEGRNEGCQDFVHFDFKINEAGRIVTARHTCKACVLTTAMADFVCEAMEGQTPDFVSTLDPFTMIDEQISPPRRECVILPVEVAKRVLVHL